VLLRVFGDLLNTALRKSHEGDLRFHILLVGAIFKVTRKKNGLNIVENRERNNCYVIAYSAIHH